MSSPADAPVSVPDDVPPHRYTAALAGRLEAKWQQRWDDEGTFFAPNPVGPLGPGRNAPADLAARSKLFVMDMFPYPSGAGLHVGHPLGYIGTDVYARFKRMTGHNVLHTMGYDAFGLPAEQYAVQTGQHPRVTTEANIANMRRQLRRLGLGHDPRRSISTTDPRYYRWTQWIFLRIFGAWFDPAADAGQGRARPIDDLIAGLDAETLEPLPGTNPYGRAWAHLDAVERRVVVDNHRLAYVSEAPVNWCPGLGTVLANEEVTADGRSDRGNFPVFKRPLRQWMMRITAYTERLLADLDRLDWPEPVKLMQRNWIGRSEGARVRFASPAGDIEVFTTRPDTLFGATYMVLAPEHPLVDALVPEAWPDGTNPGWTGGTATPRAAVDAYRRAAGARTDVDRQADTKDKTGVFTGSWAVNPTNGAQIPVFVADYVLMGYGTGAIMAVPAHDQRDFEFAQKFALPIPVVVQPPAVWFADRGLAEDTPAERWPESFNGEGVAVHSANEGVRLDGLAMAPAKHAINTWLGAHGHGEGTTTYKLRDWLFSRQRYWGEPFPIVYDETGLPIAVPDALLPVLLPEVADYSPRTFPEDDLTSAPEPPLARATEWTTVTLDLGDGPRQYRREVNVMPQWAGSCWYYLGYIDPEITEAIVDPDNERYWMGAGSGRAGGVDLYVGGVEHAVLHLLYSRFWHKVLFDLGHVSTTEPFQRLLNQGYVQAYAYTDERGAYVEAAEVEERDGTWWHGDTPVKREYGKMGKSLKNSVTPDEMYEQYGADTLRLYEMFGGPFDQSRAWETRAVTGMYRLLQRIWRNLVDEETGALRVVDTPPAEETRRLLHRTIAAVRDDMDQFKFNTAVARIYELSNHLGKACAGGTPREVADALVLLVAPLAPHVAEELWERLGHPHSLTWEAFPAADPALLAEATVEVPVQVNGKVRSKVVVAASADAAALEAAARADEKVAALLAGATVRKVVAVPGRMVSFVVG